MFLNFRKGVLQYAHTCQRYYCSDGYVDDEDESLNEQEIRHQVNRQIAAGVDAVFCLGTNGEFYILSEEEKLKVIRIVVDEVKGRVPVYAGTGCPGTKATIALSLKAKELGVDVLSIIAPILPPFPRRRSLNTTRRSPRPSTFPLSCTTCLREPATT